MTAMPNKTVTILAAILLLSGNSLYGQTGWTVPGDCSKIYPDTEKLEKNIRTLCSKAVAGSARDESGANATAAFIEKEMAGYRLMKFGGSYRQSFDTGYSKGVNVVGMLEGYRSVANNRYIIVGTHYDNLGIIDGKLYPGADSNASGVTAMLEMAGALRAQRKTGILYNTNVIFVAFDKFLDGRLGSSAFWDVIRDGHLIDQVSHNAITPDRIMLMIDIDQIGCTLVPVNKDRKDYIIALGEHSLPANKKGVLKKCNDFYGIGLDISDSYYGSENFTKAFYRLGDQRLFVDRGIPVIFFTSGITDNNNTPNDKPETIDSETLRKRIILMFRFLEKMM